MALFQPTNISPSTRGELGNGTVDATQPLAVSWQVNGNSPLTAFTITIYQNDAASTQVYTTGKRTDGCPFYGTDYAGEIQFFSYTIPAATLAGAGIANGNTYKLVITQYWSDTESVVQSSAAAFLTRAAPALTLPDIPETISTRSATFAAQYTQAQGDAINWVRWQLAYAGDLENSFYDTQNIYGTAQLQVSYDGFFRGNTYAVRCRIQTANGVEADTGWVSFQVDYSAYPLAGAVKAARASGEKSAVLVEWGRISYIPGAPSGEYHIQDGLLTLPEGSAVTWNTVNGEPAHFGQPWSILWAGQLNWKSTTAFTVTTEPGDIVLSYDYDSRALTLTIAGTVADSWAPVVPNAKLTLILTPDTLYLRKFEYGGGLYPAATLYPSATLYPKADVVPAVSRKRVEILYNQGTVTGATLGGPQICDYFSVVQGVPNAGVIQAVWEAGSCAPEYNETTYLLASFDNGLNAGNLGQTEDPLTGLSIYRRRGNGGLLQHLIDLPLNTSQLYDYGAASQQGPYVYYLFPLGATTYIADPINSNETSPCFWNWTVLECSRREDGSYRVEAEYAFGKNLSSGAVSNNNSPSVLKNFTRYPTVQLDPANYQNGTLSSFIGVIDPVTARYEDTIQLRDAIYGLATTTNPLFLKNRKGDLLRIRVGGAIAMETMDNSREQAQTVSLPWVEVGSANNVSIVVTPQDKTWEIQNGEGKA